MKPEAALHRAVAGYLRAALREPTTWTTFPAGGGGKIRGSQLKAMGLTAGFPDLLVMHPVGETGWAVSCRVIGIELKAPKGRQSPQQKATQAAFEKAGGYYHIAKSVDDVERILRACAIPLHASVMGRAA